MDGIHFHFKCPLRTVVLYFLLDEINKINAGIVYIISIIHFKSKFFNINNEAIGCINTNNCPYTDIVRTFSLLFMFFHIKYSISCINENDKIFWGVHLFNDADKLDIHVDAGRHLKTGLVKAVTLGIYLSYNWNEENGGYIEFWEGDKSSIDNPKIYRCKEKFLPVFNRCIIFENNDTSWHGAPEPCICKNNEKRIFFTLSYLSDEKSNLFENKRLKAYFVKRPQDPDDEEKDKMRILRANPETCKYIYNTNK